MKAAPSAPLEVPKANLLVEFLIVALNAPAQFGGIDQVDERDCFWKRGEPVFGRCGLAFGPLTQPAILFLAFWGVLYLVRRQHARVQSAKITNRWCLPAT